MWYLLYTSLNYLRDGMINEKVYVGYLAYIYPFPSSSGIHPLIQSSTRGLGA